MRFVNVVDGWIHSGYILVLLTFYTLQHFLIYFTSHKFSFQADLNTKTVFLFLAVIAVSKMSLI